MEKNWYSIIQYMPNNIRGEVLNIGLLLQNPKEGKLKFQLLDVNNNKLRPILSNEVLQDTYKVQKDFIEYYLEQLPKQHNLLHPDSFTNIFLEELNNVIPNGFKLSEPTFAKTKDPDLLFNSLLEAYIGKEFIGTINNMIQVNARKYVKDIFEQKKLIGTKVKQNAKLKPFKEINSVHYTIDFAYKNGIMNFLHSVPLNNEHTNTWFAKIKTILDAYQKESKFYIFYDSSPQNQDNSVKEMISYLQSKDERVSELDILSNNFTEICNKIEKEGKDIKDFENDLSA